MHKQKTYSSSALYQPVRKARICLKCNRKFISEGPGNRICPRCKGNGTNRPARDPVRIVHPEPEWSFYHQLMGE